MEWLTHEYLVPIFIGDGDITLSAARRIKRITGIVPYLLCEKASFFKKTSFRCRQVSPLRCEFLLDSLIALHDSLEGYQFPVIILCDDFSASFVREYSEEIESRFVTAEYADVISSAALYR